MFFSLTFMLRFLSFLTSYSLIFIHFLTYFSFTYLLIHLFFIPVCLKVHSLIHVADFFFRHYCCHINLLTLSFIRISFVYLFRQVVVLLMNDGDGLYQCCFYTDFLYFCFVFCIRLFFLCFYCNSCFYFYLSFPVINFSFFLIRTILLSVFFLFVAWKCCE